MTFPGPSRAFIVGNLLACSFFWGCSFLFIKLMAGEVSPLAIAAGRGLLGASALALWVIWLGQSPLPRRAEIRHWLVLGATNGWVPNVLVAYALTQLASGPAAMIQAAGPLVTAVFAHLLFAEERLSGRRLGGILLGMVGVGLLIGPRLVEAGGTALGVARHGRRHARPTPSAISMSAPCPPRSAIRRVSRSASRSSRAWWRSG